MASNAKKAKIAEKYNFLLTCQNEKQKFKNFLIGCSLNEWEKVI